jgi:hypothetical protein
MKTKLCPDATFGYATPRVGDAIDDHQAPPDVPELGAGLGGWIEHASVHHLEPKEVGPEIERDLYRVIRRVTGMLIAVGDELRGDQTDIVEDGGRDVIAQGVHEPPGLGGCLWSVRDVSLDLHRATPVQQTTATG